jgi:hypothetical protein
MVERFWAKVDKNGPNGCWLWTAALTSAAPGQAGYGLFTERKPKGVRAHRFAYELLVGPIPEGLQLDHLCRVRHCVNPAHLEPVTQRENILRSPVTPPGINARKTHCKHGHEFTPENTYREKRTNKRHCRECHRIREAERNRVKHAASSQ